MVRIHLEQQDKGRSESYLEHLIVRMPERSRGRSAKPSFVGSNPTPHSKKTSDSQWLESEVYYTKLRIDVSLVFNFASTIFALAVSRLSLLSSRVMASLMSLQSSIDNGISVME